MADVEKRSFHSEEGSRDGAVPQYTGLRGLYYKPVTQTVLLGIVCFMGPGLFNACNGLGGGGQIDQTTGANANSALYATFAAMAFFSGSVRYLRILDDRHVAEHK